MKQLQRVITSSGESVFLDVSKIMYIDHTTEQVAFDDESSRSTLVYIPGINNMKIDDKLFIETETQSFNKNCITAINGKGVCLKKGVVIELSEDKIKDLLKRLPSNTLLEYNGVDILKDNIVNVNFENRQINGNTYYSFTWEADPAPDPYAPEPEPSPEPEPIPQPELDEFNIQFCKYDDMMNLVYSSFWETETGDNTDAHITHYYANMVADDLSSYVGIRFQSVSDSSYNVQLENAVEYGLMEDIVNPGTYLLDAAHKFDTSDFFGITIEYRKSESKWYIVELGIVKDKAPNIPNDINIVLPDMPYEMNKVDDTHWNFTTWDGCIAGGQSFYFDGGLGFNPIQISYCPAFWGEGVIESGGHITLLDGYNITGTIALNYDYGMSGWILNLTVSHV